MCAPVHESGMCAAGRHIGRPPTGVAMLICILAGLRMSGSCSGRGMPRPYRGQMCLVFWWGCDCQVACSGRGKPRPYKGTRQIGDLVGAHLCVRPCTKAACVQRADTSVGPYRDYKRILCFGGVANADFVQRAGHAPPLQVADVFGILMGLHMLVVCSGRGKPRPYKGTIRSPHARKERHMALRLVY